MVDNTSQIPEIIGREAQKCFGQSIGDTLSGVHQSISADHPQRLLVCVMITYVHSGIFSDDSKYRL